MRKESDIRVIFIAKSHFELYDEVILKKLGHPNIKKAILFSKDQNFKIIFYTNFSKIKDAVEQTATIINKIDSLITYNYNHGLEKISLLDAYDLQKNMFRSTTFTSSSLKGEVIRHIKDATAVEELLEDRLTNNYSPYIDIFTGIDKMVNPIAKFIMYYSILSDLFKRQKEVDDFIKKEEPSVEMWKTTRTGANFKETIYSYIRNQIGHSNKKTNPEHVRIKSEEYLYKLRSIVKKAIDEFA